MPQIPDLPEQSLANLSDPDLLIVLDNESGVVRKVTLANLIAEVLDGINPDPDFETEQTTIANGTGYSFSHGLSATPNRIEILLECVTSEGNWGVGDQVLLPHRDSSSAGNFNALIAKNGSNVLVTIGANGLRLFDRSSGANLTITNANWKLVVRAWA